MNVEINEFFDEEAEIEVEKAKANLSSIEMRAHAGNHDAKSRLEYSTLEVKQAQIRAEMKRLQSEMTQVQLELAKARFDHLKVILSQKTRKGAAAGEIRDRR